MTEIIRLSKISKKFSQNKKDIIVLKNRNKYFIINLKNGHNLV